ncbi:MAG: tripartite tricarboxylate transporter substrate binding protein [Pseudomonas sp.]|uniref:tripartite tricarboxylate transporter substrate binding protein n=1 Tax=Pseudomonadota TaxID=1224 RepID=UPI002724C281|nr:MULTISPECIES: tripartite tricarboxylate transporter substrate binding protein [Pseudomonadota]MDO9618516.1 tripartite tricarboxylate transporter substrate binding protein [Pseudomonas sp.]MDP2441574.1 tripartite tricarboxylate transporter substrate binding protein [Rhodoferax sp.]MDZ4333062.1 tripartite tricarboxylate transporter substrate binding protein [Pseudomonas sp.]
MALLRFLLLSGCLGLLPWQIQAASFPERPLTMIIGYAAGGSTDVQGRVLAQVLEEQLGQKVTVSNIPGAGGAASASMLASSIEQGYVFQFGGSSVVSIAPLLSPASYGPDSFTYVAGLSLEQPAFVTGATHGIQDWPGLLAYLRATPGQIYVSQAAEDRLIIRALAKREGLELRTVPTSGGAGMAPLVISGDAVFAYSGGTHAGYTESGEMRVLASLADTRLLGYPDAPTLRELGYDMGLHTMRIVMVPANTPAEQVETLAAALAVAVKDPRFIEVTEQRYRQPVVFMRGDEIKPMLLRQMHEYRTLIDDIGLH